MTVETGAPRFPQVGLTWGIKRSFIRYIAGLADGSHSERDGAYLSESSSFTFPVAPETGTISDGVLRFRGTVRIGGHGGMLGVLLSDPCIEMSGDTGILSVIDPAGYPGRYRRVPLAELVIERDVHEGVQILRCAASLAEPGVEVFAGHYPQGVDLDPVVIR